MKKLLTVFAALCLLIGLVSGCTPREDVPDLPTEPTQAAPDRPKLLEFMGLPWDSTPQEANQILHLDAYDTQEGYSASEVNGAYDSYVIHAAAFPAYGTEISLFLAFEDTQGFGHYGLKAVQCYFPEDTDIPTLRDRISEDFGESVEEYTSYSFAPDFVSSVMKMTMTAADYRSALWVSEQNLQQYLPQEELNHALSVLSHRETSPVVYKEEDILQYFRNPVAMARLSYNPNSPLARAEGHTGLSLKIDSEVSYWLHMPTLVDPDTVPPESISTDDIHLRAPEEIQIHSFQVADQELARQAAENYACGLDVYDADLQDLHLAYVAYDPIYTDYLVRLEIARQSQPNRSEDLYWSHYLGFTARYESDDPEAPPVFFCIALVSKLTTWTLQGIEPPPADILTGIMDPALLSAVDPFAVAAYEQPNGSVTAYLRNPIGGEITPRLG